LAKVREDGAVGALGLSDSRQASRIQCAAGESAIAQVRIRKIQQLPIWSVLRYCFAVVMNSQLLLPNPLMPHEVRMVHLVETATSNFLFGWLIVLVLRGWSKPECKSAPISRV
jgi:hypothetical protein